MPAMGMAIGIAPMAMPAAAPGGMAMLRPPVMPAGGIAMGAIMPAVDWGSGCGS